jgi:hypothetical protein
LKTVNLRAAQETAEQQPYLGRFQSPQRAQKLQRSANHIATTSREGAMRKLPAVCILYGTAEGPTHSRTLRQLLEHKGFRITEDPRTADIILAHSGGYFLIPADTRDKIILLVGPCNGYKGTSLLLTQLRKIAIDLNIA